MRYNDCPIFLQIIDNYFWGFSFTRLVTTRRIFVRMSGLSCDSSPRSIQPVRCLALSWMDSSLKTLAKEQVKFLFNGIISLGKPGNQPIRRLSWPWASFPSHVHNLFCTLTSMCIKGKVHIQLNNSRGIQDEGKSWLGKTLLFSPL